MPVFGYKFIPSDNESILPRQATSNLNQVSNAKLYNISLI